MPKKITTVLYAPVYLEYDMQIIEMMQPVCNLCNNRAFSLEKKKYRLAPLGIIDTELKLPLQPL